MFYDIYVFQFAFLVTSTVLFAGGIVNFFGLVSTPKELGKLGLIEIFSHHSFAPKESRRAEIL